MISSEAIKNIRERKEFAELLKYLAEEAVKLNTISDLDEIPWNEITGIVKARLEAYKTLQRILEPLIDLPDLTPKSKADSYEV